MLQQLVSRLRDYAELTKARITTLIVLTAWCGYFFGAHRLGVSSWSLGLFHALLGVALVSSGTAALNEVLEASVDAQMRRTALRPLPSGRMTTAHAATVGLALPDSRFAHVGRGTPERRASWSCVSPRPSRSCLIFLAM